MVHSPRGVGGARAGPERLSKHVCPQQPEMQIQTRYQCAGSRWAQSRRLAVPGAEVRLGPAAGWGTAWPCSGRLSSAVTSQVGTSSHRRNAPREGKRSQCPSPGQVSACAETRQELQLQQHGHSLEMYELKTQDHKQIQHMYIKNT